MGAAAWPFSAVPQGQSLDVSLRIEAAIVPASCRGLGRTSRPD